MTHVLLASPGLSVGGAERVVLQLAHGLLMRGHTVTVSGPTGPLEDELPARAGRVLLDEHGRSLLGAGQGTLVLASAIRRLRPDVVHGHNVKASLLASVGARLAAPRGRPRLVATFHGVRPAEYPMAARLLRSVDAVACVSAELQQSLNTAGVPAERLHLVHNAVAMPPPLDDDQRRRLDETLGLNDQPVVLAVGRLVEQKRHDRLLEVAAHLTSSGVHAQFLVAGDGPLRSALEQQAQKLGVAEAVRFLGLRRDVPTLLARADILLFSSDWEGLSIAALEGLAAGTPIVTTPVEGMNALLGDGAAGLLAQDMTPAALADVLRRLLEAPQDRERMSRAGRVLVRESFAIEPMLDAYERLYASS